MLADAYEYAKREIAPLYPFGVVGAPFWEYFFGNFTGMSASFWPYWLNSFPPGQIFSEGWSILVPILDGSQFYTPGTLDLSRSINSNSTEIRIPGEEGRAYTARMRVRSVSALMNYAGGTSNGHFQEGGSVASDQADIVRLTTTDPIRTYYLNRSETLNNYNESVDYTVEIPVVGGALMTLYIENQDYFQWIGDRFGRIIEVAGHGFRDGIWATVDLELRATNGTLSTITTRKGGGVRGFAWQGFVENIYKNKAER
jgi:hypothetical protein